MSTFVRTFSSSNYGWWCVNALLMYSSLELLTSQGDFSTSVAALKLHGKKMSSNDLAMRRDRWQLPHYQPGDTFNAGQAIREIRRTRLAVGNYVSYNVKVEDSGEGIRYERNFGVVLEVLRSTIMRKEHQTYDRSAIEETTAYYIMYCFVDQAGNDQVGFDVVAHGNPNLSSIVQLGFPNYDRNAENGYRHPLETWEHVWIGDSYDYLEDYYGDDYRMHYESQFVQVFKKTPNFFEKFRQYLKLAQGYSRQVILGSKLKKDEREVFNVGSEQAAKEPQMKGWYGLVMTMGEYNGSKKDKYTNEYGNVEKGAHMKKAAGNLKITNEDTFLEAHQEEFSKRGVKRDYRVVVYDKTWAYLEYVDELRWIGVVGANKLLSATGLPFTILAQAEKSSYDSASLNTIGKLTSWMKRLGSGIVNGVSGWTSRRLGKSDVESRHDEEVVRVPVDEEVPVSEEVVAGEELVQTQTMLIGQKIISPSDEFNYDIYPVRESSPFDSRVRQTLNEIAKLVQPGVSWNELDARLIGSIDFRKRDDILGQTLPKLDEFATYTNGWLVFSRPTCYSALLYFAGREGASVESVFREFRNKYDDDNIDGMIEAAKLGLEELKENLATLQGLHNASSNVVEGVAVLSGIAPVTGVPVLSD